MTRPREPGTCHILTLHLDGRWMAYCKPHQWESDWYGAPSWANAAAQQHQQEKEAE